MKNAPVMMAANKTYTTGHPARAECGVAQTNPQRIYGAASNKATKNTATTSRINHTNVRPPKMPRIFTTVPDEMFTCVSVFCCKYTMRVLSRAQGAGSGRDHPLDSTARATSGVTLRRFALPEWFRVERDSGGSESPPEPPLFCLAFYLVVLDIDH